MKAGWPGGFQLNGDVTYKFCRASVDSVEFGVDSILQKDCVLCLSIISKATESEKIYQITIGEVRAAVLLLLSMIGCNVAGCVCYCKIMVAGCFSATLKY
jgi:hypothetical protein